MLRHILVKGDHDPTLRQRKEIAFVPAQSCVRLHLAHTDLVYIIKVLPQLPIKG